MTLRTALVSAVVAILVVATALLMDWPLQRAAMLAPVLVVLAAATAGIFVLWGRIAYEQLRASKHPRTIVAVTLGGLAVFVVLAVLGVTLPHE